GGSLDADTVLSLAITPVTIAGQQVPIPRSMSVEATGAYSSQIDFSGTKGGLNELRKRLNGLLSRGLIKKIGGLGLTTKSGKTLKIEAKIDFEQHPDALASLVAFVPALAAAHAD